MRRGRVNNRGLKPLIPKQHNFVNHKIRFILECTNVKDVHEVQRFLADSTAYEWDMLPMFLGKILPPSSVSKRPCRCSNTQIQRRQKEAGIWAPFLP